jgi:hypothetical protein
MLFFVKFFRNSRQQLEHRMKPELTMENPQNKITHSIFIPQERSKFLGKDQLQKNLTRTRTITHTMQTRSEKVNSGKRIVDSKIKRFRTTP